MRSRRRHARREPALPRRSPALLPATEDPEVETDANASLFSFAAVTAVAAIPGADGIEGLRRERLVPCGCRFRECRSRYGPRPSRDAARRRAESGRQPGRRSDHAMRVALDEKRSCGPGRLGARQWGAKGRPRCGVRQRPERTCERLTCDRRLAVRAHRTVIPFEHGHHTECGTGAFRGQSCRPARGAVTWLRGSRRAVGSSAGVCRFSDASPRTVSRDSGQISVEDWFARLSAERGSRRRGVVSAAGRPSGEAGRARSGLPLRRTTREPRGENQPDQGGFTMV